MTTPNPIPLGHLTSSLTDDELIATAAALVRGDNTMYHRAGVCASGILCFLDEIAGHIDDPAALPLVEAARSACSELVEVPGDETHMPIIAKMVGPLSLYIDNVRYALNMEPLFTREALIDKFHHLAAPRASTAAEREAAVPRNLLLIYRNAVGGAWILYDQLTSGSKMAPSEREDLKNRLIHKIADINDRVLDKASDPYEP